MYSSKECGPYARIYVLLAKEIPSFIHDHENERCYGSLSFCKDRKLLYPYVKSSKVCDLCLFLTFNNVYFSSVKDLGLNASHNDVTDSWPKLFTFVSFSNIHDYSNLLRLNLRFYTKFYFYCFYFSWFLLFGGNMEPR